MNPQIKFQIDYKKDIKTFYAFANDISFDNGRSFEWAIIKSHPFFNKFYNKKTKIITVKKEVVVKYVENIYKKKGPIIKRNLKIYKTNWLDKKDEFYKLVDDLFGNFTWPKGKYIAYTTIWNMYPRFLDDKTFQLPIRYRDKKYINTVIAHEMLHFIFYDYFYKKYPKYKNPKHNLLIWHVSEIFNAIVLNSKEWQTFLEKFCKVYPEHEKIISHISKKNKNNLPNIDTIIRDILNEKLHYIIIENN